MKKGLIKFTYLILIAAPAALVSCFNEVNLTEVAFEDLLVIDARITDEVINHEIVINRTVPVTTDSIRPEEGATVRVVINDTESIDFPEVSPGVYRSSRPFGATFNSFYYLSISTDDGNNYQSSRETMLETPSVDRVSGNFERFDISLFEGDGTFSFQYDAELDANGQKLYLVEWTETYLVKVPFPSNFIWRGGSVIEQRTNAENVETCYRTEKSNKIITHESLIPSGAITGFPLRTFETVGLNPLALRYSLEVKQFALSNEAYNYWQQIGRSREDENSLIQLQPGSITGNIQNIQNDDETVLGRFDVLDEEGRRLFFTPDDFEESGYQVMDDNAIVCDTTGLVRSRQEEVERVLTGSPNLEIWFIDNGIDFESQEAIPILVYLPKSCSNCTFYGENERPTFWTD